MEEGSVGGILSEPTHPYSKILLELAPRLSREGDVRAVTELLQARTRGSDTAAGCSFADRCPFAVEKCFKEPPLRKTVNGRLVLCHRAQELVGVSVLAH